mgnify:CR=1 FL=1
MTISIAITVSQSMPPYIVHNHSELGWDTSFVTILEVVKLLIQYVFLPGQYFFIANTNSLTKSIATNYKSINIYKSIKQL